MGDVRGKGLFWGIEFVRDKGTNEPFAPGEAVAMEIHELGTSTQNFEPLLPCSRLAETLQTVDFDDYMYLGCTDFYL